MSEFDSKFIFEGFVFAHWHYLLKTGPPLFNKQSLQIPKSVILI